MPRIYRKQLLERFREMIARHGSYGASSMERLPVETALTEEVRVFKIAFPVSS
jgi:predicted TIM-barrel enzyme